MRAAVLVDAPVLFPGRCLCCGRSKGRMVDTQIDIEGDMARVYLCVDVCVPTFARLLGLDDTTEADEKLTEALARVTDLETELAELGPVRSAIIDAAARFGDTQFDDEPIHRKQAAA